MSDEIKEILDEFENLFNTTEAPEHIINDFSKIKKCIINLQGKCDKAMKLLEDFYNNRSVPLRNISKAYEVLRGDDEE